MASSMICRGSLQTSRQVKASGLKLPNDLNHMQVFKKREKSTKLQQEPMAACSWQRQPWQLLIVFLTSVQLVLEPVAYADTSNYSIDRKRSLAEEEEEQYFQTVPQDLDATGEKTAPRLGSLIEGPKGKQVQQCTKKCVPTCIRGGQGAPGLGPMSMRKEIVVFKEGYRTRSYCLSECTQVCSLQLNGKLKEEATK